MSSAVCSDRHTHTHSQCYQLTLAPLVPSCTERRDRPNLSVRMYRPGQVGQLSVYVCVFCLSSFRLVFFYFVYFPLILFSHSSYSLIGVSGQFHWSVGGVHTPSLIPSVIKYSFFKGPRCIYHHVFIKLRAAGC